MAKIDIEARKFTRPYQTTKGIRWKVCIPNGHGGQIRAQKFLDQSAATEFAKIEFTKILRHTNKGLLFSNTKIYFSEFVEQWLKTKAHDGLAAVTLKRYRNQIDLYLNPYFGSFRLNELSKPLLRSYINDSLKNQISSYNLRNTVIIFKMIVRQAIEDDLIDAAGILTVRTPKHKPKDPIFWDQLEMRYFLNAAKISKKYQLWKFVLLTGMRAGEISALKWESVQLELHSGGHTGFIKVCRTVAQRTKIVRETTKNGENRMIPIMPELRNLILEMKNQNNGTFVFGGKEPLEPAHFSRDLQSDLANIPNLRKITFHGLRHTFCSMLESTGLGRRIVAEIMGHKDLSTTDRYSHVSNQTLGIEFCRWTESQIQQNSNKLSLIAF